jgi:hypothetical protein
MRERFLGEWAAGEARVFSEKAYKRRSLPEWDVRWQQLTVQARYSYLHLVKLPEKISAGYRPPPSTPRDNFPPDVLEELAAAGFVTIDVTRSNATIDRVFAGTGADDFAWRGRILRRMHLLDAHQQSEFSKYVEEVFFGSDLLQAIASVLRGVGFEGHYYQLDDLIRRHVVGHRWQEWVVQAINNPLTKPILKLVTESGGAIPLLELVGGIKGSKPDEVRSVVDKLIVHLALVEDFRPESLELMVGILPAVREKMTLACQPRERPPLLVCPSPKELAPHGSVIINDLRAVLLEIANGPPRLRGDFVLYQTERKRFLPALEPLPPWLFELLGWSTESRLNQAVEWARALQMVKPASDGPNIRIQLGTAGHLWLSSDLHEQYTKVFNYLTQEAARGERSLSQRPFFDPGGDFSRHPSAETKRFFGEHITVQKVENRGTLPRNWGTIKPAHQVSLRPFVERALAALEPGVFYKLDSVISHLAFPEHNPLNAGLPPDRTAITLAFASVPPFDEEREEAGKSLIETFVLSRLIPLGCVRAAIDDKNTICIAREASYGLYFGRRIAPAALLAPSDVVGKVVVQPDFSVIVIGLNPASLAELTLFCERTTKGSGHGATVLKITRESVVKAVRLGLKPAEILARLTRYSSNPLPANVQHEINEWSSWVRRVTLSKVTILRCGDAETADRVMAVLRRRTERLSETLVAIDQAELAAKDRDKLLGQGIIVQADSDVREADEERETDDSIF